jgi:hypothetical protein
MAKVITFSRVFPAYHPKAGQPTYFVEQIWNSFNVKAGGEEFIAPFDHGVQELNSKLPHATVCGFLNELQMRVIYTLKKYHTIRGGNRWKVGDKFSPRVWSGKPYQSKQIIIAHDIEIKKVWDIEIWRGSRNLSVAINIEGINYMVPWVDVAENDGLTIEDFESWFNLKPFQEFKGQIICWNDQINYPV